MGLPLPVLVSRPGDCPASRIRRAPVSADLVPCEVGVSAAGKPAAAYTGG